MKFAKHLYMSENMKKKKNKVIYRLRRRKVQFPVYVIALCNYGRERMEILSSAELLQPGYPDESILVAGIAGDYEEALELVRRITQEAFESSHETDICGYIHDREREK